MPSKSKPVPPTSRRSARQERLASREANRQLSRAGTRGSGAGGDLGGLLLWTVAAVVIGIVVIGGAWFITRTPSGANLPDPMPPGKTTAADVQSAGRTLGNPNAPVTIDLYSDFRCTGCFSFAMEIEPQIVKNYLATGKAKLVYHDLIVIDKMQDVTESRDAANAARCAADQGKFWLFHDWLFANQSARELKGYFTVDRLLYMGRAAGLDATSFEPCVREGTHVEEVEADEASAPAGTSSTPTILVQGKLVENSKNPGYIPTYDDIKKVIEAALNPTASPSASASATASPS